MTIGVVEAGALLTAAAACVTDLRSRRIPNALTFGSAAVAFLAHAIGGGPPAAGWAALGWAVGAGLFLPYFLLGGMGAGDVKLVAAIGAWLGPALVVWVGLSAAVAGGALALALAARQGSVGQSFRNLWGLVGYWRAVGPQPHPGLTLAGSSGPRLAYAVPVLAGLVVALWLKR